MKVLLKFIFGYIIGITVFLILIPLGFYKLSALDGAVINRVLIGNNAIKYIISFLFFFAGTYFMLWSNIFLFKTGKGGPSDAFGISFSPQTKKLVTTGPYCFSRNPMVFGALCIYASIVIILNSITGLFALMIFIVFIVIYLKLSEEKRLIKDFGNDYLEYKKKVSMIFPFKIPGNKME